MEYIRKNGMIDINNAIENGQIIFNEIERKGARKNKFWFNNYTWMYKEVDNDYGTYEEYAEMICYEIAKILNIDCAEYDLATYNGKKGVITRSVVNSNEKILSGTQLLNYVYEDFFVPQILLYEKFKTLLNLYKINSFDDYEKISTTDKFTFKKQLIDFYNQSCFSIEKFASYNDTAVIKPIFEYCEELGKMYTSNFIEMKNGIIMSNNLYDIWYATELFCEINGYTIDIEKFMSDLTNIFMFDIIVSQGDRHADNWSILIDKETDCVRLAAMYDNSGALALNRGKAIINIDDFSKRLKIETKPGKIKGIYRKMQETIDHSFSGVKITEEDVKNRNKNDLLIDAFISQSSTDFISRLGDSVSLLKGDVINDIFSNIELKTGVPIPEIVKNVTREVLNYNIQRIDERISVLRGENHESRKL